MDKKISRKEAIKKVGLTTLASTSLFLLETKASSSTSSHHGETKTYGDDYKRGRDYGHKDKSDDYKGSKDKGDDRKDHKDDKGKDKKRK